MKLKHIFVFFISLLAFTQLSFSQSEESVEKEVIKDTATTSRKQFYGLRLGIDLSKPIRTLVDPDYSGFEVVGDFRIRKNHYLAAEIGNETRTSIFPNINNTTRGSYIKAGFNYNAYENWFGMNNLIFAGARAGFASFRQELNSYTIYTTNPLFGDDTRIDSREFTGLNATWLEFQFGIQTEILNNLYLGLTLQLKRSITQTDPDDFQNIYIPGFGKTTDDSSFGVGYGYTVSYLIPLFKR